MDLKIHTAPQGAVAQKVTRGLREHMIDFHKTVRAPRKMKIEKVKSDVLPRSS